MSGRDVFAWEAWSDGSGRPPHLTAVRRNVSPVDTGMTEVRVRFSGLCGSDTGKLCQDSWSGPLPEGWVPGHEVVGIDTQTGTWVAVNPLVNCNRCSACADGRIHLCTDLLRVGWELPGGLAESLSVPVANAVPLPAGAEKPAVFVLADPMAVALHGVRCGLPAPTASGTSVLGVIGGGTLGICTAVCAADAGWEVFITTRRPEHQELLDPLLGGLGAHSVEELPAAACDAVIDAASGQSASPLLHALEAVRDGGTILVQNAYAPQVTLSTPLREVFRRSLTLRGSFSHCRANNADDFQDALHLLHREADTAWAAALTSTRYPLAWLPDALAALHPDSAHRPLKALIACRR